MSNIICGHAGARTHMIYVYFSQKQLYSRVSLSHSPLAEFYIQTELLLLLFATAKFKPDYSFNAKQKCGFHTVTTILFWTTAVCAVFVYIIVYGLVFQYRYQNDTDNALPGNTGDFWRLLDVSRSYLFVRCPRRDRKDFFFIFHAHYDIYVVANIQS